MLPIQPESNRRAPSFGANEPSLSWLSGENALGSVTGSRSGSRTNSAPDGSGPHSHFWAETV